MRKKKEKFVCPKCNYVIGTCHQKHLAYCDGSGPRKYKKRLSKSDATKKLWENDNYRNKVVDSLKMLNLNRPVWQKQRKRKLKDEKKFERKF